MIDGWACKLRPDENLHPPPGRDTAPNGPRASGRQVTFGRRPWCEDRENIVRKPTFFPIGGRRASGTANALGGSRRCLDDGNKAGLLRQRAEEIESSWKVQIRAVIAHATIGSAALARAGPTLPTAERRRRSRIRHRVPVLQQASPKTPSHTSLRPNGLQERSNAGTQSYSNSARVASGREGRWARCPVLASLVWTRFNRIQPGGVVPAGPKGHALQVMPEYG